MELQLLCFCIKCEVACNVKHVTFFYFIDVNSMPHYLVILQGDQKVSVHLMITIQKAGAQRLSDHPVHALHYVSFSFTINFYI